MKLAYITCIFLFVFSFPVIGKAVIPDSKPIRSGNTVALIISGEQYRIEVCTPSIIRIREASADGFAPDEQYMVNRYDWDEVAFTLTNKKGIIEIKTSELLLKISTKTFSAAFYTPEGELINRDAPDFPAGHVQGKPSCFKELLPGEHFFGFGERMDFMDQVGKRLTLDVGRGTAGDHETGAYNILEANYCPVPFFMSTRGSVRA